MPFVMKPAADKLLRGSEAMPIGIAHLHLATAEQLRRLHHYSPGSMTRVKAHLKALTDAGYLTASARPTTDASKPYYYTLATESFKYLRDLGYDIPRGARASKEHDKQAAHIDHTLELNNIIIAAALLGQADPTYRLARFIHERELKRPQYKYDVVPDALLDFRKTLPDGRERRKAVLIEHDRGNEHINAFKPRIRGYVKMLQQLAYERLYGVGKVTIAFTTNKTAHVRKLMDWTKQELERLGSQEDAKLFVFTRVASPFEPSALWLEPVWQTLNTDGPVPLLAG